ncbi:PREDICTED: uncharacterized protein LOC108766520 isoform X1 [Trachymyrmex cornetzi]|uniref:uncharacterized protein LOC108766520 isoform X1 n=2 Tax=Trachymyrmex cornetzi TaxID=471704 RepID=UPI00084F7051|nr:PREDICTED: uncharacterized protein LOC108766520 isoform X1 [Trachymyrmex cornetzi]
MDNSMNVDENNLNISYTCGVCETFIIEDNLLSHTCFNEYSNVCIDENFYCYPQCEDGSIVRKSLMPDGTEDIVTTIPHTVKGAVNSHKSVDLETKKMEIEEQLIDEIFKRPGLWNFKLPITERSPQIKKQLWEEIYEAMNGSFPSIEMIKRKWKSLSDSFRVHSKKNQQASGSAASGKKPWIHLQRMQFLNDVRLESRTVSNIDTMSEFDDSQSNVFHDDSNSCNNSSNSRSTSRYEYFFTESSKRRMSEDNPLDQIANSLEAPISFNIEQIDQILSNRISNNIPPIMFDKPASMGHLVTLLLRDMNPELLWTM